MVTQEMYDGGLRCKGQGLNCIDCKDKAECVQLKNSTPKKTMKIKYEGMVRLAFEVEVKVDAHTGKTPSEIALYFDKVIEEELRDTLEEVDVSIVNSTVEV